MALSAEQKADIGRRYFDTITNRIAVRKKAQEDANKRAHQLDDNADAVVAFAKQLATELGLADTGFESVSINKSYRGPITLQVVWKTGMSLRMPIERVTGLRTIVRETDDAEKLGHDLCRELEFLHDKLDDIAQFQAHASRLWAPTGKDTLVSDATLKDLIETFLAAKRPAVCAR